MTEAQTNETKKQSNKNALAPIVLICIAVVVAALVVFQARKGNNQNGKNAQTPPGVGGADFIKGGPSIDWKGGPEDAKVVVIAYYPGNKNGIESTIPVKKLVKEFPGKVRVEIVDWRFPEGLKRKREAGLTCAGILINGSDTKTIIENGEKREVWFARRIGGEWTEKDLILAVQQEVEKQYGEKVTPVLQKENTKKIDEK